MNKEFLPYEQALALKELGFDEPCFGSYDPFGSKQLSCSGIYTYGNCIAAPLYQQAFSWFREKYGICSWIDRLYTDDHVLYYRYTCEKSIESPPNYNKTWITLKEYNT